jgi:hypothetical protein
MAGTADYREEVLSNLLDLQAELRGEARDDDAVVAEEDSGAPTPPVDAVTVTTSGLQVRVAPSSAAVAERLAALSARLSRLEADLASVGHRMDGVQREPEPAPAPPADDAPWRSFLDLQKIVADRLDGR